ncbi:YadA-like family protein [Acidaminococcus sp. HCP3S3_G9_1]|uniref:YadA-like family protein n=1 Tax=Acidaminococcus sp. HCP3S3_G9_1 TaxID=3438732 RepID=UPI003F8F5B65
MNKIFKVVWSKAKRCWVVTSEYGRSTHKKSLTGKILATIFAGMVAAGNMAYAADPVTYDDSTKSTVSLGGASGTKISNVADGQLAAGSKDAVNGRQLYATNQSIADLNNSVLENAANIGDLQTNVINIKTANSQLKSKVNTLDTQVTTGWNATIDGAKVKTINPSANYLNFTTGDDIELADPGNGSIQISVKPTGKVEVGNTHVVSGDVVYQAINTLSTDTDSKLALKANVNASNIGKNLKGSDGITPATEEEQKANLNQWGEAIGTGSIASDSSQLVTGKTVYSEVRPTADGKYVKTTKTTGENLAALDTQVGTNTGDIKDLKDLKNITEAGQTVIKNLSKDAVQVKAGDRVKVDEAVDDATGNKTYTISAKNDGKVEKGNTDLVSGDTVNTAIENAIQDSTTDTDSKLALKANVDASNIGKNLKGSDGITPATEEEQKANLNQWGEAIGTGSIASDSSQLVTGKTVYSEVRPTADGKYVKTTKTTGENLAALDTQVGTNTGDIKDLKDLKNITEAGQTVIKNLSKDAVQVKAGDRVKVDEAVGDATGNKTYTISAKNDGKVEKGNTDLVSGDTVNTAMEGLKTSIADLKGNVVLYDSSLKDVVTFAGTNGTRLTNLMDARLTESSTDAVTGRQLYATNQSIAGFANDIANNTKTIATLRKAVTNTQSSVTAIGSSVDSMDGLKADASLNNLSDAGKQVIVNAANDAIQAYMKNLKTGGSPSTSTTASPAKAATTTVSTNSLLSTSLLTKKAPVNLMASLMAADTGTASDTAVPVNYDDSTKATISLGGASGTTVSNVADGQLAAGSKDAVNGRQLYATNQSIADLNNSVLENASNIGSVQSDVINIKTANSQLKSTVNTLNTQVTTGWNATIDGAKVKTINPSANYLNFATGDDVKLTDNNGSIKIALAASGKVEAGNTHAVTGDAVYKALANTPTVGAMEGKANTALDNLNDTGKQIVKDLAKEAVAADLDTKANTDASNIDVGSWSRKLATGKAEAGNTGLVNGNALYEAVKDKADKDSVYTKDETYNRSEIDSKVSGMNTALDGKANTSLDNITDAGKQVIKDTLKADLDKKADTEGSNIDTDAWTEKLATGKVEDGNTSMVTGGTVYKALKDISASSGLVKDDGNTVSVSSDSASTVVDMTNKDGNARIVKGVETDGTDATSAANVGYVEGKTQDLKRDIQDMGSRLTQDIDRAGANAAALAALHPLDYDPDNKLEFAGGYGHYRGANAGALAAFYHPDENVILSLGGTMGNGNSMVNAGVTFKLGPKGHAALSRTALTNALRKEQEKNKVAMAQIQGLNSKVERLESLVQTLMAKADK